MIEYRGASITFKPHTGGNGGFEFFIRLPSHKGDGRYGGVRTCRAYAESAAKTQIDRALDVNRVADKFFSMPLRMGV